MLSGDRLTSEPKNAKRAILRFYVPRYPEFCRVFCKGQRTKIIFPVPPTGLGSRGRPSYLADGTRLGLVRMDLRRLLKARQNKSLCGARFVRSSTRSNPLQPPRRLWLCVSPRTFAEALASPLRPSARGRLCQVCGRPSKAGNARRRNSHMGVPSSVRARHWRPAQGVSTRSPGRHWLRSGRVGSAALFASRGSPFPIHAVSRTSGPAGKGFESARVPEQDFFQVPLLLARISFS